MDFRQMIKTEAKLRGISINKLCTQAGVPKETVFRYLNNLGCSIHCDTLYKLVQFCGYEVTKKDV